MYASTSANIITVTITIVITIIVNMNGYQDLPISLQDCMFFWGPSRNMTSAAGPDSAPSSHGDCARHVWEGCGKWLGAWIKLL